LKQICNQIPGHLVSKLAQEHGVDDRKFSAWSHVVSLLYAQLSRAPGLNALCDALGLNQGKVGSIRGATAPARNTLSNANRTRPATMAEALFWSVLEHLRNINPSFGGRKYRGFPRRFKRVINVVDSSTIELVANCMDWARHRRKKAAAKLHLRMDLASFLPKFVLVDTAADSDCGRARELCASVGRGEIVIFDKAYVDFEYLYDLHRRGAWWVTRAKTNLGAKVVRRRLKRPCGRILSDDEVVVVAPVSRKRYPEKLRLIRAVVELEGKEVEMSFLTNHFEWSAQTVADLYKCRWGIEVFFKQLKQTLQLCDFLGHNKNAIQWQVWMALLAYVLLRYLAHLSQWPHSFTRLCALIRSGLWCCFELVCILQAYGTAGGDFRLLDAPRQGDLFGFVP
jgi:hypothetical protein